MAEMNLFSALRIEFETGSALSRALSRVGKYQASKGLRVSDYKSPRTEILPEHRPEKLARIQRQLGTDIYESIKMKKGDMLVCDSTLHDTFRFPKQMIASNLEAPLGHAHKAVVRDHPARRAPTRVMNAGAPPFHSPCRADTIPLTDRAEP
jgi:hypothetical protein